MTRPALLTRRRGSALIAVLIALGALPALGSVAAATPPSPASTTPIYDASANAAARMAGEGFQADGISEFGNEITFSGLAGPLRRVTVTMSDWACEQGELTHTGANACVTTPGTTFDVPITLTVYEVGPGDAVGSPIATQTQTFAIPFRPSADPACTGALLGDFMLNGFCSSGLPTDINFDFTGNAPLPGSVIYGIAFDTSDFGANPHGHSTSCYVSSHSGGSQFCPYDALNVGLNTAGAPTLGTNPLPGTAFLEARPTAYCDGGDAGSGTFRLDSPGHACWTPSGTPGSPYRFAAVRFDAAAPVSAPLDPAASVALNPAPGTATVSWDAPASDGGSPITGYTVTPEDLTSGSSGSASHVGANTTTIVTGLEPGHLYDFTVSAKTALADGPTATTNQVVPLAADGAVSDTGTSTDDAGTASAAVGPPGSEGSIVATASGSGTIIVAAIDSNPIPSAAEAEAFYDVSIAPGNTFSEVSFTICGIHAGQQVHWWNPMGSPAGYQPVSDQTAPSGPGSCVVVRIDDATSPNLSQMVGTVFAVPPARAQGYMFAASDGGVFAFGDRPFAGSMVGKPLAKSIVGTASTPDGGGYWLVAADGGVFAFGDAAFYGSAGALHLRAPIVGMTRTPSGEGYWLVAADGGVFSFGDAQFHGGTGALALRAPIVGAAASPSGHGYWLVASDGGVFSFGDAPFLGSAGSLKLVKPIVGIAASPAEPGYWLVASDGGVFNYGAARFHGSAGAIPLVKPIVGIGPTADGEGYWLAASDGGAFTYGDAAFWGSLGAKPLAEPVVGIAS